MSTKGSAVDQLLNRLEGRTVEDIANTTGLPEELRGMTPAQLVDVVEVLDAHIRALHQNDDGTLKDRTPEEQSAFDYALLLREKAVAKVEEDRRIVAVFENKPKSVVATLAALKAGGRDDAYGDVRRMSTTEARNAAMRKLDGDRGATAHLDDAAKVQIEKMLNLDSNLGRRILVTENDDYRNAWMKLVTQPQPLLEPEEIRAVNAWREFQNAASENTGSAGGFGIPVFIDPSIILTAQGSGNPFLEIAKQVTVNTNQWKGVSSAGVTWTFQTEAAPATDASPTLAQPSVLVHMARGFIPYSIEVGQDYPSFAAEMAGLLAEGYDELLVDKFTRGSGTGEPKGILTALSANSSVRVKAATAGAIGAADPYAVWKAVPQRFRRNASWLMSVGVNNAIAQLGAANVYHAYTVGLADNQVEKLRNRPVYESPYMPDTTTFTTATEGMAVVGDFSNFVVARAGGMSVELIPQLFQQVTAGSGPAVPTGQRGWFAYARIGSNSVNDLAFRLLVNS